MPELSFTNISTALAGRQRLDGLPCPGCRGSFLRAVQLDGDRIGIICRGCPTQGIIDRPVADPWQSETWFHVCRDHQEKVNHVIRLKPPKPWMQGTMPTAQQRAMRRHWPRDPGRRVLRIMVQGGVPCER